MRQNAIIIATLTLLPALALAGRAEGGYFELSSSDVERVQRDASGRVIQRSVEHWDVNGDFRGTSVWTHRYTARGTVAETRRVSRRADGHLTESMKTRWYHDKQGRTHKMKRVVKDGQGTPTRYENSSWDRDRAVGNTLVTTRVYSGEQELQETRYTIHTHAEGRQVSSDTSVFDPRGVQLRRHLHEWRGQVVHRWHFDERDEVRSHDVERSHRDRDNRVVRVEVDSFDGSGRATGSRVETRRYVKGEVRTRVITWFDVTDMATQRMTTHTAADGTRRTQWERWVSQLTSDQTDR